MQIDEVEKAGRIILRVREDLAAKSDLAPLKARILGHLEKGRVNIALSFTENSYLHTQTIAMLVQCIEAVHERGGMLGLINPNEDIRSVLNTISLDKLVRLMPSEDEIA